MEYIIYVLMAFVGASAAFFGWKECAYLYIGLFLGALLTYLELMRLW